MTRVSVLVPVHDGASCVGETIDSVLAQTCGEWECLLVDDGSKDDSLAVLRAAADRDARLRVVSQSNAGTQAARNHGLELARGEWVALLDHDDLWLPEKLERQLALADANPRADLVFCNYAHWDGREEVATAWSREGAPPDANDLERQVRHCQFGALTVMVRRERLVEAGGFDTRFLRCGDWDLWLRLLERGVRCVGTSEVLARWRVWAENLSGDVIAMREEEVRVLEGAVERCADPRQRSIYARAAAERRGNLVLRRALRDRPSDGAALRGALWSAWRLAPWRTRVGLFALGASLPAALGGRSTLAGAAAKIERSW